MGEQRELTKEELKAIKAKANYEAAEFKAKLAALPEKCAIDKDILKIRKLETGRTVKELGLVDKEMDEIHKRTKGALLDYMQTEAKKPRGAHSSHKVTPTSRNLVLLMTAGDSTQTQIAEVLGICREMVGRKYREELEIGKKLLAEGIECGLKFCAALAYYDKGRTGSHHLYATNKSTMRPQGRIDITNSDGTLMPLIFVESNGRDKQINRDTLLKQLASRRGDVIEGEVIQND